MFNGFGKKKKQRTDSDRARLASVPITVQPETLHYVCPSTLLPPGHGASPSGSLQIEIDHRKICPGTSPPATVIVLDYRLPAGVQLSYHQHPGVRYHSIQRKAYLPNNEHGHALLVRMKYAWMHGHCFKIGYSLAFQQDNRITWATVLHKTSLSGGEFGFPDPNYIENAHGCLDALGVPPADGCLLYFTTAGAGNNAPQNQQAPAVAPSAPLPPSMPPPPAAAPSYSLPSASSFSSNNTSSSNNNTPHEIPRSGFSMTYHAPRALHSSDMEDLWTVQSASASSSTTTTAAPLPPPMAPPAASAPPASMIVDLTGSSAAAAMSASAPPASLQPAVLSSATPAATAPINGDKKKDDDNGVHNEECACCLDLLFGDGAGPVIQLNKCGHVFHKACMEKAISFQGKQCPKCRTSLAQPQGKCPSGTMTVSIMSDGRQCPGFPDSTGVIRIQYLIPSGIQAAYHDTPGRAFTGDGRTAYLPLNDAGKQVLSRLRYAFMRGLIFRVGTSLTSGKKDTITWGTIHHKTSLSGGPHGFPCDNYMANVNKALDNHKVPPADDCWKDLQQQM